MYFNNLNNDDNNNQNEVLETLEETETLDEPETLDTPYDEKQPNIEFNQIANPTPKPKKKGHGGLIFLLLLIALLAGGYFFVLKGDINNLKSLFGQKETKTSEVQNNIKEEYKITSNKLTDFDLYFMQLENKKENKVYSPLSIKYALEMLGEGAKENTKTQIDAIIGDYVSKKYPNDEHMSFANALFIKESFKKNVNSNYKDILSKNYNAELIYDDFKTPDTINKWVSEKTYNLIGELIDDVSDLDFALVNALAIDMEWNKLIQAKTTDYNVTFPHEDFYEFISGIGLGGYPSMEFNGQKNRKAVEIGAVVNKYDIVKELGEENIRKTVIEEYHKWLQENAEQMEFDREHNPSDFADIYPDDDTMIENYMNELKSNVGHISSSTDFEFYVDDDIKVFAKDLKKYNGVTLQYIGIMPTKIDLDEYIKNIKAKDLNELISKIKTVELENFEDKYITLISGTLPLFNYEYELKLMDDLKELGITEVFDKEKANLSGIVNGAYINKASHKANIEFSNEGIKAAAATIFGGGGSTNGGFDYVYKVPIKEIDLTFDKPFMYLIRDKDTGEVWFTGNVYEAKEMDEEYEGQIE